MAHKPTSRSACDAYFTVSTNEVNRVVQVTWLGSMDQNKVVVYNWGDGQNSGNLLSFNANASHTYTTDGNYSIQATVIDTSQANGCSESYEESVSINVMCALTIKATAGTGGVYTFQPQLVLLPNGVNPVEWQWSFGDGNTETVQGVNGTISHTYDCEASYPVTLKLITTSSSCSPTSLPKTVNVEGIDCYDDDYKSGWKTISYSNNNNKIVHKTWAGLNVWFQRKLVKAKVKNYRKKNGKWKKDKQQIKIEFDGKVYTTGATGCNGGNDVELTGWREKKCKNPNSFRKHIQLVWCEQ